MKTLTLTESQIKSLRHALQDVVEIYEDTSPDDKSYDTNNYVAEDLRDILWQMEGM